MIKYDLAIVGGGLAGLALAIQVRKAGYSVILFEKEKYPFHRVCGEYISNESWPFLLGLGVNLEAMGVSHINRVRVSAVNGRSFEQELPLGGFGVSRYTLDFTMAKIARQAGVELREQTRVNDIQLSGDGFDITSTTGNFRAAVTAGCYGKRSNLDIKWKRPFTIARKNKLNNYVGVKYHIRHPFPDDLIGLHTFKNGYCGISKVEGDQYCFCYLTSADNLLRSNGDVRRMEQTILSVNPHLWEVFRACQRVHDPVTISQISFDRKATVENHVLMIGDAAGMIAPLCGNGMSMALHGSKIAAEQIQLFLKGSISREQMETNYTNDWNRLFASRLRSGRVLQRLLTNNMLTTCMIVLGRAFPGITRALIKRTHGQVF